MPIKGWYDLTPEGTAQAIINLDYQSVSGNSPISVDFIQTRLDSINGQVVPETWLNAQKHLEDIKLRIFRK
jgi:hypothetical protein